MTSLLLDPLRKTFLTTLEIPGGTTTLVGVLNGLTRVATSLGATTILAPVANDDGSFFVVEDRDGQAAANPITISGNGKLIDGTATTLLNVAGLAASFVLDGGQWRRVVQTRAFDDDVPVKFFTRVTDLAAGGGGGDGPPVGALQSNWFVGASSGSDSNDGASALTPIKTLTTLAQRIGALDGYPFLPGTLSTAISPIQLFTINLIDGNFTAADMLRFRATLPPNSLVAIVGTATTVLASAVTAVTVQNRATNSAVRITDATVNWTTHLGRRVRNTTAGANLGQIGWVVKDIGGGVAEIGTTNNPNLPPPADRLFQTATTPGVWSAGDTYVIEDLTQVYVENVDIASSFNGTATVPVVGFANVHFLKAGTSPLSGVLLPRGNCEAIFKGCRFGASFLSQATSLRNHLVNCGFDAGGNVVASSVFFYGGGTRGAIAARRGSFLFFTADMRFQGSTGLTLFDSVSAQLGNTAFFDSTTGGVNISSTLNAGASANVQYEGAQWGSGNAFGVDMLTGTVVRYLAGVLANLTVTGTVAEFRQAGAVTHRSWDEGAGAYTAPIANTWAGIINDNAQNVGRRCLIALAN